MDAASPVRRAEPQGTTDLIPARTPNWKPRALILALVCFVASGVIIAASFMPWLSAETGHAFRFSDGSLRQTVSGWDIYVSERDAGEIGLVVTGPLADGSRRAPLFATGLGTLISGLSLGGLTVLYLVLGALAPAWFRKTALFIIWVVAVTGLLIVAAFVVVLPPWSLAWAYFVEHGAASGASLEYGPFLLWVASVVGILGAFYLPNVRIVEARNARLANAMRRPREVTRSP